MNKIYEDVNKKFFIYENIIEEELFEQMDEEVNQQLALGNQNIRFQIFDKRNKTTFSINQKNYVDLNDYEKEMYYTESDENFEVMRNDADIWHTSNTLQTKLNNSITKVVEQEYGLDNIERESASFIHYKPGHFMKLHSDATPWSPRLCTAVLYCNIENKNNVGGDVLFYDDEGENIIYTYTPTRNQLVIFDSHINKTGIPHSVTTIKNWNRYVYRIYFKTPQSLL